MQTSEQQQLYRPNPRCINLTVQVDDTWVGTTVSSSACHVTWFQQTAFTYFSIYYIVMPDIKQMMKIRQDGSIQVRLLFRLSKFQLLSSCVSN